MTAVDHNGSAENSTLLTAMSHLAFSEGATSRVKKLLGAYVAGQTAWSVAQRFYRSARSQVTYTVSVPGEDDIYPDIHEWVLNRIPSRRLRAVTVRAGTVRSDEIHVTPDDGPTREARLIMLYDGTREQVVEIGGHRVHVRVEREQGFQGGSDNASLNLQRLMREKIIFTAYGPAAREAVVTFLDEVAQTKMRSRRGADLYLAERWGGWRRRPDLPRRPLATVILAGDQREQLVTDLNAFFASEDAYGRIGVPWHRGYLLHGPPGTGKTSIARALATHFDLDLYYMPLSDLENDVSLMQTVAAVRPRSMLLLEDVDVLHAAKQRDDSQPGVTLTGLLNTLDGVATPHGLITVMTTNDRTVLDPALVRPGRVDVEVYIGHLDDDQLARINESIFGEPFDFDRVPPGITPADVIEVLKPHLDEPARAEKALLGFLAERGETAWTL